MAGIDFVCCANAALRRVSHPPASSAFCSAGILPALLTFRPSGARHPELARIADGTLGGTGCFFAYVAAAFTVGILPPLLRRRS
jgi:hypothetical protein